MQDFDQSFFEGATAELQRREGATPFRALSRPSPCFLAPNIFDTPPPLTTQLLVHGTDFHLIRCKTR